MDLILLVLAIALPLMLNEKINKIRKEKINRNKNKKESYKELSRKGYEVYKYGNFDYDFKHV